MQNLTFDQDKPVGGSELDVPLKNLANSEMGLPRYVKRNSQIHVPHASKFEERKRHLSDAMTPYESPNFLVKDLPRKLDISQVKGEHGHEGFSSEGEEFASLNEISEQRKQKLSYYTGRKQSANRKYLEREIVLRTPTREKERILGGTVKKIHPMVALDHKPIQVRGKAFTPAGQFLYSSP